MPASEHTVGRWLTDSAAIVPDRVAIDFLDDQITYRALRDKAARCLEELVRAKLRPGERIATLTRNCPAHVELFFACALGGFVMVPLNWRLTVPELAWQISDVQPAVVLAEDALLSVAREAVDLAGTASTVGILGSLLSMAIPGRDTASCLPANPVKLWPGSPNAPGPLGVPGSPGSADVLGSLDVPGSPGSARPPSAPGVPGSPRKGDTSRVVFDSARAVELDADPHSDVYSAAREGELEPDISSVAHDDDPLLIIYTSGTTGRPKGAVLTHANCFWTNLSLDRCAEVRTDDVVLQVLPQCHVAGWNVQPLLAWWKGATVVLEADFDPGRVLERIATKGVTTLMGVPTTYLLLAQDPGFSTAELSSLRQVVVGGAPMPVTLLDTWASRGVTVLQGYGLTEAAPNVLCVPATYARQKQGSAGRPYPYVEVGLRSLEREDVIDEAGRDLSLVKGVGTGELLVAGPNVFGGYWRDPTSTAGTIRGGWLATGDVAERDADGFYWIRGRLKEMFISGGENVYPAEIEAVMATSDVVADVAVVGVPNARWGETGCAFVVPRPGSEPSASALMAYCRQRLAGYKVPRHLYFIDEIPRLANGKVDKVRLTVRARELTAKQDKQGPDATKEKA